ncbi:MAG: hypothetical protein Q7O66_01805 [Dehalococcoidia bacterium]|nr:hypothetical protein [Dehalococcoidia bacterium]
MAREQHLKRFDIGNDPELLRLVQEVRSSNEPRILQSENEDVAIVRPLKLPSRRRSPRGKPFSKDDPIWNLAGVGASGLGDVSENKHKYLADTYADLHE